MTAPRGGAVLYTPAILGLAVELAQFPLVGEHAWRGEAHSRVCGSRVVMGVDADAAGAISAIGAKVTACAIGQASAALFLRAAKGCDTARIAAAMSEIEGWLAGDDTLPDWPDIALLASARAYPARHAAIVLPWKAALAALSNRAGGR